MTLNKRDITITDKLKGNLKTRADDWIKRGYSIIREGTGRDNYHSTFYWVVLRKDSTK